MPSPPKSPKDKTQTQNIPMQLQGRRGCVMLKRDQVLETQRQHPTKILSSDIIARHQVKKFDKWRNKKKGKSYVDFLSFAFRFDEWFFIMLYPNRAVNLCI